MSVLRDKANFRVLSIARDFGGNPLGLGSADDPKNFDKWVGKHPDFATQQEHMAATKFAVTCCNEFAGQFFKALTGDYGLFDLRSFVMAKRPYAWIDASSGAEPKVGDILQYNEPFLHLGVARAALSSGYSSVYNNTLYKVEAGQGGVHYQQDYINFTRSAFPSPGLVGWVDVDLYEFGPDYSDDDDADLKTLDGKWTVWGDNRRFRWAYTFSAASATVTWRDVFNGEHGGGTFAFVAGRLKIHWSSGTVDMWELPIDPDGTTGMEMSGSSSIDLVATKD